MPTFDVTIRGKSYHVEVPDPGGMPLHVIVDGEAFEVGIAGTETWVAPQPMPAAVQAPVSAPRLTRPPQATPPVWTEGEEIIAPMPGTILSVEVQSGQPVEGGQIVCVLEAMKMKNPIRAIRGGTVVQIAVQAGQNISHGDLLVRLS
jgi:biotin carboxyl carrier protein